MVHSEFKDSTYRDYDSCDPNQQLCFGKHGGQVLETIHQVFAVVDNNNTFAEDVGCNLLIALVAKVVFFSYVLSLSRKATKLVAENTHKIGPSL
jgi:hypothetical protein